MNAIEMIKREMRKIKLADCHRGEITVESVREAARLAGMYTAYENALALMGVSECEIAAVCDDAVESE